MPGALRQVKDWVQTSDHARLITFTNVHMVVEASVKPAFHEILERMDLNCPDGAPIFWMLNKRHGKQVAKISGPEFMPEFCQMSVELGCRHFLYGGADGVAEKTAEALKRNHPGIEDCGLPDPSLPPPRARGDAGDRGDHQPERSRRALGLSGLPQAGDLDERDAQPAQRQGRTRRGTGL